MIFSLDVRRARKGDCLILHYGTKEKPGLALIDGGPAQVYTPYLKPRLLEIRKARGIGEDESLVVDLLMVSHIDDDHVNGILELTNDLVIAKDSKRPLPLKVRSFWHNTFDDIIGNKPDELLAAVAASYGPAALGPEPNGEGLDPDVARILASVGQGFRLRDDARKLNFRTNPQFKGKLVMASAGGRTIDMGKGLVMTVAGPMEAELVALQKSHDAFLEKQKDKRATKEALSSFTDKSVANLSSIVVLAEAGDKRMLLTGDARGDKVLEGLELVGLVEKGGMMHVDVLKVPHHGSSHNVDPVFFRRITADHYVFSGNGDHGNPERDTLQMVMDNAGNRGFTIHLTYPIEEIDRGRKRDWEQEQEKEKVRKKRNPEVVVRKNWSDEEHSLRAFFSAHKGFAQKVTVVRETEPHVINLLEEVAF